MIEATVNQKDTVLVIQLDGETGRDLYYSNFLVLTLEPGSSAHIIIKNGQIQKNDPLHAEIEKAAYALSFTSDVTALNTVRTYPGVKDVQLAQWITLEE